MGMHLIKLFSGQKESKSSLIRIRVWNATSVEPYVRLGDI